jgi:hypothetical protein
VKSVGGVIAGVGALGFVALVGGAIFYAQMAALGLPADRIVEAMSRSTLLVVGARMLVPLMAGVALCLALVRLFDRCIKARLVGICVVALAFLGFVGVDVVHRAHGSLCLAVAAALMAAILGSVVWVVGIRPTSGPDENEQRPEGPDENEQRPDFRVFGVATTVAAALFAAALGTALAYLAPAVRAVAVARNGASDIAGIYAASNPTEVIIGEVCQAKPHSFRGSKRSGVLVVVPRSDITTMLISTNRRLSSAIEAEGVLLKRLAVKRDLDGTKAPSSSRPRAACTAALPMSLRNVRNESVPGINQGP